MSFGGFSFRCSYVVATFRTFPEISLGVTPEEDNDTGR
jgi:hypothetical protein